MDDAIAVESRGLEALPEILSRAGSRRILLVTGTSGRHVERVRALLAGFDVTVFAGARRHVPDTVVDSARQALRACHADTLLALGGGSAIGLAKALRLEQELTFVAIPTTYSGSERTSLYGITRRGEKQTGRDPRVRPNAVIHDVSLTLDMPRTLTVTSLMNALAHPVAALAAATGEERERALAAAEAVYLALEALVRSPRDPRARAQALRGASLAALALEGGNLGAHHQLAHRLGGAFDLDHGAIHSLLLPHSVQRLRAERPDAVAELETRLGVTDLEAQLFDLLVRAGAGTSLRALAVELPALESFCRDHSDVPAELLGAAFHGRRPSATVRREDWGLREPVSLRGPALGVARRVVVAVHGRGATADGILGRVLELVGSDPSVAVVAPQARNNAWYQARYNATRAELGDELTTALKELNTVLERALAQSSPDRVVLFGFSQGACLALELFMRRGKRLDGLVALSGAMIGPPDEAPESRSGIAGTPVLLGASAEDPHLLAGDVERTARHLEAAGCQVTVEMTPGNGHALHTRHRILARDLLSGKRTRSELIGFGNAHASEALPGALPRTQNTPRKAPYGLYPELTSGSAFTAARNENFRTWTYRVRPAAQQGELRPLEHPTFVDDFESSAPEPNLTGFAALPLPAAAADFLDGLTTIGGAGSARLRRGYAVHVYAANRSMEDRAFYDADGELLLLPELGALSIMTELGVLDVTPGELAIVPRGVRFSVLLRGASARGYVAEVFGRRFTLPERGPLGSNGLADARHFRAPSAWHEDRLAPGYRIAAKVGGALYEATQDYSPYDVAAWHGNHCPYAYDLASFTPAGFTRVDHPDPSIHTVLSAPLDEQGVHTLDLVVFPPRWDSTEGTFRPPYFHRNATTEINGIVRETVSDPDSPFVPGCLFVTPGMTPHGPMARSAERAFALSPELADRPHRYPESACWFQFETALPFSLTRVARDAAHRLPDWHARWGAYRSHFDPSRL